MPRGTWRHVTNAIVVPALWRIEWCRSRPDRLRRSGAINGKCLNTQTHIHTYKHHPANVNFNPLRSKSSFLRMDLVHSSSLRFWTSGRHYFILPWVQNRNCLNQKTQKSKFRKNQNFDPPNFWTPLNFIILRDLVALHPCTKFGVPRSNDVCARGDKAGKRDCALRAQF